MQIDIVSPAPNAAPGADPTSAASEETAGSGSFAKLLDAVADESTEPAVEEDSAEENSSDVWITAPVLVPFIPVIPVQEVIEGQLPGATNVETGEEGTSIDAIDGVAVVATGESRMTDAAAIDPTTSAPQIGAAAGSSTGAVSTPMDEVPNANAEMSTVELPTAEMPALESATEVETIASMLSNDPVAAEPLKKAGEPAPMPESPETSDPAGAAMATQTLANTAVQGTATEGAASSGTSTTNDTPVEPASNHKGVAARLARALERAAEAPAPHRAETASGEGGQAFDQGGNHQGSFGDWLREQLPHATSAGAQSPSTPAFNFVAPVHHDAPIASVTGSAETSLMPGAPLPREHDVTMQIVQSLRLQFRDGIGEAVLKLKPEHLGSVAISLRVENGGLKANVQADLPAVRQWLESQQDTLRSALAEQGLRLDRFDVEPDGQRQTSQEDAQERSPRKRQAQRTQKADQPVFEVVV